MNQDKVGQEWLTKCRLGNLVVHYVFWVVKETRFYYKKWGIKTQGINQFMEKEG